MICGYQSACNNKGGIRSIALIEASLIENAEYDAVDNVFLSLTLKEGAEFCEIDFYEDSASLTETFSRDKGCSRVSHSLSFVVYSAQSDSYDYLLRLMHAELGGIVAIVTDNASRSYLVGYSSRFGSERPLNLAQGFSDSASSLSDQSLTAISLSSEDVSKSLLFSGQVQTLLA